VVDYGADDVTDRIRDAAGGDVDVVLETHAAANVATDRDGLTRGGRIVVLSEEAAILERVGPRRANGSFEVEVGATYPLEDAAEAQRHVLSSGSRGKEVLEVA